tara:strand:+ start:316 stop:1254 length:939 start_codon:yes stop_codon:yes gene_type:complete
MNILYIKEKDTPDYSSDALFHGIKNLDGVNVEEGSDDTSWYMYNTEESKNRWMEEWGNDKGAGFTLSHTINTDSVIGKDVEEKIKDRYYDRIIYGCIWNNLKYLDEVKKYYDSKRVIFIDGSDEEFNWYENINGVQKVTQCRGFTLREGLENIGLYFKREIPTTFFGDVIPISFAFPEELIVDGVPFDKKQDWCPLTGTNFPDWVEVSDKRYGFGEQDLYYEEIQKSRYGFTMRKAGWDCMRHYEIMGNGTIPHFHKLEDCPPKTLHNFPKELILKTNKKKPNDSYNDVVLEMLDYMRNNLTTKKLAEYVLG